MITLNFQTLNFKLKTMAEHNETGTKGEEMAADYLTNKGYEILEKNWRFKNLEADIIAIIAKTLVVAEVKTRKSNYFGEPETFVNKQKQSNLIKTAHEYIQRNNLDLEVRFDIISIITGTNPITVNHIEDAFYPKVR
jgi:putative endonuclease